MAPTVLCRVRRHQITARESVIDSNSQTERDADEEPPRIGSPLESRVFSLSEAQALFPLVVKITRQSHAELQPLQQRLRVLPRGSVELARAERQYRQIVNGWVNKMRRLGLTVKGLWLVDFDTGDGYLCWKYPELNLGHFHGYAEGFAGRRRLEEVIEELDPDWAHG